MEIMPSLAYLISKSYMSYPEIMELPYSVFRALIKQFSVFDMMQTEEGRNHLQKLEILNQTEPELNKLRSFMKK